MSKEKAESAIKYLEDMRKEHAGNYGVETSIDNRIPVIRMYLQWKDWNALETFYREEKEEGYLAGWEYPSK